jgi:biofilm PGA synthesis N-glycosyltransferase PgaC
MADIVMGIGIYFFLILFLFLLFTFFTALISVFFKKRYGKYEPFVSVIVPCYNEEKNIENCVNAIFSLDYPKDKLEVIVLDDGSTDKTATILRELKKKYKKLKIVTCKRDREEQGVWRKPYVLNLGVKKSKYDIIFAVDSDTFLDKACLKNLVLPLQKEHVGVTNGSCIVRNKKTVLGMFQGIEYYYHNLMRKSFSNLFGNLVWFFGAFACYKKQVLEKIGGFKKLTLTEDMDTAMEVYRAGYRVLNVHNALGFTTVPDTIRGFFNQRIRWWIGGLQTLKKNKDLLSFKSNLSILFLFFNHYWWTFFAILFFPLIIYQILFWLPSNNQSFIAVFMYLFRWFSFLGPIYVIYKIPEWGISLYSFFGVISGIITVVMIVWAIYMFKGKITLRNLIGIFFYFPYTIVLNIVIFISIIKRIFLKQKYLIYSSKNN